MELVGITQKEWDEAWYKLPPVLRYAAEESQNMKFGYPLLRVGDLLVWPDDNIASDVVNQRLSDTLAGIKFSLYGEAEKLASFSSAHFEEFDGPLTISNATKLYGTLWYGNRHPTLVISSKENKEDMMRKLIPNLEMKWHKGKRSFQFHGAVWKDSEEITDGKVYMLNENEPCSPKLNGWFEVKTT